MSKESINLRAWRRWGLPIGALAAWGAVTVGGAVWAYDYDRTHAPVRVDYDGPEVVVEDGAHLSEFQGASSRCGNADGGFTAQPEAAYAQPQDPNKIISYVFSLGDISVAGPNSCDSSQVVVDASFTQPASAS